MEIQEVHEISLDDIKLNGVNVRTDLDTPNSQENLNELSESIRINGLMQPIVLRGRYGNPPYDIVVGQRRFLAHQLLKKEKIKATFSGELSDTEALLLSLSENMCRQEMNYADTANAITKLYNDFNKDEREVQKRLGISLRTIRNYIKIEDLATEKIKKFLIEGAVSLTDAKRVLEASDGDNVKADKLIEEISSLTRYEKKRIVDISKKNNSATAEEIIEEAKKPLLQESIILVLPLGVHKALQEASEKLALDPEEITLNALISWLKTNDFFVESN